MLGKTAAETSLESNNMEFGNFLSKGFLADHNLNTEIPMVTGSTSSSCSHKSKSSLYVCHIEKTSG